MENLTANEQLDYVLDLYYDDTSEAEFESTYGKVTIKEIGMKLRLDGYLREEIIERQYPITYNKYNEVNWYISFEGRRFKEQGGYGAKALRDEAAFLSIKSENQRKLTLDKNLEENSTRLNRLTFWLAVGTIGLSVMEIIKFLCEIDPCVKAFFEKTL